MNRMMHIRIVKTLLVLALVISLIASGNLATTAASFTDIETATNNSFQAWSASLWTRTTQTDFEAGVSSQIDTSSSPGDVILATISGWYDSDWTYRRQVTIDHTKVDDVADPSTAYAEFPVLVYATGLSNILPNGADIRFTSSDGVTELPREIESYSAGTLYAWVKVTLTKDASDSADDIIYMYYGNTLALEPLANSTYGSENVWDSNFMMVQHMKDNPDTSHTADSTSNGNHGTKTSANEPNEVNENMDKAQDFSSDYISCGSLAIANSYTAECWINADTLNGSGDQDTYGFTIMASAVSGAGYPLWLAARGTEVRLWAYESTASVGGWRQTTGASLTTDNWFHIVATAIQSGDTKVFVNGVEKLSFTNDGERNWTNIFTLGDLRPGRAIYFDGAIDEVRISDTVRSAQWINTGYNNQDSLSAFCSIGGEVGLYVSPGTLASQVLDTGVTGAVWNMLFWDETGTSVDWYNNNWQYRRAISLSPATPVDNYQALITLTTAEMGNPYSNINANGSDIRFTGANMVTQQDYWIESWDNTGTSYIWVEVAMPGTPAIYMYYGNAAAASASDGILTFDFFDDFSGDLSKWTIDPENTDKVYIDGVQGNSAPALRHDPDSSQTKNGYFDTRLMTSGYIIGNGVIEYDVYLAGAPRIIHQLGFRVDSLSFTDGYCWRMQNSATDGGWLRFNNGSWSKIGTNWGPTTGGVWHSVKMQVLDTNFTAYIDGGGAISVTDNNKQTEDYLVSHVHGVSLTASSYVLVDNVRVRKYASVEPTSSVGTAENQPAQVLDITFMVRASDTPFNAGDTTPFWGVVGGTSPITSGLPSGRYMQWRARLTTSDTANTPTLHEVRVYYY